MEQFENLESMGYLGTRNLTGKNKRKEKLWFNITIYQLWLERNKRIHDHDLRTIQMISSYIDFMATTIIEDI